YQPKPFRQRGVGAGGEVTCAGMVQCREVHPNLMCAAGFQLDIEKARCLMCLERVVMGDAVTANLGDREFPVVSAVASDRRVDGSAGRIGMALHQSVIALLDG